MLCARMLTQKTIYKGGHIFGIDMFFEYQHHNLIWYLFTRSACLELDFGHEHTETFE